MKAEDITIRPQFLNQYKGQPVAVSSLQIMIAGAKKRQEPLDHILIMGPGGLGKTTLANCIGNEMNTRVKCVTAANPMTDAEFQTILTSMSEGEILFIDEIHALSTSKVEMMYTVMEDFYFDTVVTFRNITQPVRHDLRPFTVIGATTNPEKLTGPLRTRFAMQLTLDYLSADSIADLLVTSAERLGFALTRPAAELVARRSRGTPRVANGLLKRVRDFAEVNYNGVADTACATEAMASLQIDDAGLDAADRKLLQTIIRFGNQPMGINMLASALRESKQVIEEMREPFLIEQGFILRTPRGRMVTEQGIAHLNG